jgi:hypothetical protein
MYFIYAVVSIAYFGFSTIYDQPYSLTMEACHRTEPRHLSPLKIIIISVPTMFSVASLTTDILLIRFLHKTILPQSRIKPSEGVVPTLSEIEDPQCQHHSGKTGDFRFNSELQLLETHNCNCWIRNWIAAFKMDSAEKVPIRVSFLSSSLIFPYIIVQAISGALGLTPVQRTYVNWIAIAIANTLRCPMTVILAFKSNPKLAASRKREIQDEIVGALPIEQNRKYQTESNSESF